MNDKMRQQGNDRSVPELSDFERRTREVLHESAEQLDGRTRSRLTQARHAALEAVELRRTHVWKWATPAIGAAAAILAVVLSVDTSRRAEQPAAFANVDALEIVTAEDSLEFYRDVEFYSWVDTVLDDEPQTPQPAKSEV